MDRKLQMATSMSSLRWQFLEIFGSWLIRASLAIPPHLPILVQGTHLLRATVTGSVGVYGMLGPRPHAVLPYAR